MTSLRFGFVSIPEPISDDHLVECTRWVFDGGIVCHVGDRIHRDHPLVAMHPACFKPLEPAEGD